MKDMKKKKGSVDRKGTKKEKETVDTRTVETAKRIYGILTDLAAGLTLEVSQLSEKYDVSRWTIRSDLIWMQNDLRMPLSRSGGEATLAKDSAAGHDRYDRRRKLHQRQKDLIGAFAANNCVVERDRLILDGGSTLEAFVKNLNLDPTPELRVVTASDFCDAFDEATVYVQLGGAFDSWGRAFVDSAKLRTGNFFFESAGSFLREFCVGYKAIISGSAFSEEHGLSGGTWPVVRLKRVFLDVASEVIILLDHAKFTAPTSGAHTITYCGFMPDPWLTTPKSAVLIVDDFSDWDKNEPPAFKTFKERATETTSEKEREFQVRSFKFTLLPGRLNSWRTR